MATYGAEMHGSMNVSTRSNAEQQGSMIVASADGMLVWRVTAYESEATTFGDMDEYAQDLGYADSATMLSELGYATELAFAQAHGQSSVAAFLSQVAYPSLEDVLSAAGVTFVQS